jgi:hypothetical protein
VSFAKAVREVVALPPRETPWTGGFADLIVTGDDCRMYGNFVGQGPIALTPGLAAQVLAFREEDAKELPEAGLWFRAALKLDPDGVLGVQRSYLNEPNRSEIQLDDAGLKKDALRMPRTAHWMPEWLARRVSGAVDAPSLS